MQHKLHAAHYSATEIGTNRTETTEAGMHTQSQV